MFLDKLLVRSLVSWVSRMKRLLALSHLCLELSISWMRLSWSSWSVEWTLRRMIERMTLYSLSHRCMERTINRSLH